MAHQHVLVLDSEVRDWVFIPLTLFIVLMKLVMQYMHQVSCVRWLMTMRGALCPLMCASVGSVGGDQRRCGKTLRSARSLDRARCVGAALPLLLQRTLAPLNPYRPHPKHPNLPNTQPTQQAMSSAPPAANKELPEVREQQAAARSQRARALSGWLPEPAVRMRRRFFADPDCGVFSAKPVSRGMHEAIVTDPSFVSDMMKRNMSGMLPQILMGTMVTFFFSGFVMGKVPFGLSPRFRPMLQRGVDLAALDVAYFTGESSFQTSKLSGRGMVGWW